MIACAFQRRAARAALNAALNAALRSSAGRGSTAGRQLQQKAERDLHWTLPPLAHTFFGPSTQPCMEYGGARSPAVRGLGSACCFSCKRQSFLDYAPIDSRPMLVSTRS
eukprot:TRINITY_DN8029_c0_g1_i1.p1 TRINITY_DN8029_c0_g1~~TRINITY_DN8029_c0_g1_i1.p1  ORF type:complete len:109 (-),score=10.95 TRINITY_DN8029_c0_g1_i1:18-344(-)